LPDAKQPSAPVRPFWAGTITFGLVSIPVELVAAVAPRQKSMKLVDEQGHALGRRYYCPKDEKVLDNDELVRGYETDAGKMVIVTDEEFASVAPEKSRDIELKRFVPLESIPPFFFDRPYFLAPDERAGKAYALLALTMAKTGKAGIGSFVMRGHEYLVAILAENGILRAETLRYADELRTPESIGLPKPGKPDAKLAGALAKQIEALAKPGLDESELADVDVEALRKLAQQKAKSGKGVVAMESLEDVDDDAGGSAEVIDLMQALRNSLGASSGARKAPAKASTKTSTAKKRAAGKKTTPKKGATAKGATAKGATAKKAAVKTERGRRSA
jgi:DNA end-binding protein Ku